MSSAPRASSARLVRALALGNLPGVSNVRTAGGEIQARPTDIHQMKTLVGLAVVGVLASSGLTGCGHRVTVASPLDAGRAAEEMLALAPRLPGALTTSAFSEQAFIVPAQEPACQPLSIRTAFLSSTMTGPAAVSYLETHVEPHFQLEATGSGSGSGGVASWSVVLEPDPSSVTLPPANRPDDTLVYSIARQRTGIGVRVDAVVVPDDAECARS